MRRQVRALTLAAHRRAVLADLGRACACSAEMRSRARRRSVSICVSPGPRVRARVPIPPSRRSRCVHSPRMRARLYSSWASSTWSLPSAVCAWPAKMSRMIAVRSMTGTPRARLEVALLARRELVVDGDDVGVGLLQRRLQLVELARSRGRCSGAAARGAGRAGRRSTTPAVHRSSRNSDRSSPSGSAAIRNARWRALPGGRARLRRAPFRVGAPYPFLLSSNTVQCRRGADGNP